MIIKEIKSLIAFAKKPVYKFQQQPFNLNLKRFGFILFIDIIFMVVSMGLFSAIAFFGLNEIFKNHKNMEIFNEVPLVLVTFLMVFFAPILEELIFRLHLKYRRWVINILLPLAIIIISTLLIDTNSSIITIGVILIGLIILTLFIIFNLKITTCLEQVWNKKFNLVFYISTILFALIHITNYELSVTVLLLTPILILPQFISGFLIGYLRVKSGFIWGVTLHMVGNAILILPILISISMAFPSTQIQNNVYNLTIEKGLPNQKHNSSTSISEDSITIINYSFKECLSLLLNKEENIIEFDDSFMAMGIPLLKAEILLHIDYKNQNSENEIENTVFTNKQNILNELQRIYKFELITENDIESVKVIFQ